MDIAIIDIVFIGVIIVFALRCAVRGFVSELMSMAALILGLFTAIFFFRTGAEIVRGRFMPDVAIIPEVIAFVLLFLAVFFVIKMVEILLKGIIEGIRLGGADRFLGCIFGIAEGIVIVCLLLFLINIQPFFDPEPLLRGSFIADFLLPFIFGARQQVLEHVVLLPRGAHV